MGVEGLKMRMRPSRRALSGALRRGAGKGARNRGYELQRRQQERFSPGPVFSEDAAARDSRPFTSIQNLSSKCLVLEARAWEAPWTVPGGAGDRR